MASKRTTKTSGPDVTVSLREANEKLAAGEAPGALHVLLDAWREKRAPAIADAIEALSARLTANLPKIAGEKPADMHAAWIAIAREGSELDVDRLAPGLLGEPKNTLAERVHEMLARPHDPRIATALFAMVRSPPTTASERYPMWTAIFKHLAALDDARVRALGEELAKAPPHAFAGDWPQLSAKFRVFEKSLKKMEAPPLGGDELSAVAALQKTIAGADGKIFAATAQRLTTKSTEKSAAAGKTHEEFLAAIHADPEADAPRQIYADWLLEQGDPRGTFIAEQFASGKQYGAPKLHKKLWIAEIAPLLEGAGEGEWKHCVKFRRGFLSSVMLKQDLSAKRYAELVKHPMLSTLEAIYPRGDTARIISPQMKALRSGCFTFEGFTRVCELPFELGLRSISVGSDATPELEARVVAAKAPVFAHLRHIDLSLARSEWFLRSWIVERVNSVTTRVAWKAIPDLPLAAFMEALIAHENLTFVGWNGAVTLLRRDGELVLHLYLANISTQGDLAFARMLEGVPNELARRFALEPATHDSPESLAMHAPVAAVLAERFPAFRHRPLSTTELQPPHDETTADD